MANFKEVPVRKTRVKKPRREPFLMRMSSSGNCSVNQTLYDSLGYNFQSIRFEIDEVSSEFRFRLGQGHLRKLSDKTFFIPEEVAGAIQKRYFGFSRYRSVYFEMENVEGYWVPIAVGDKKTALVKLTGGHDVP